MNLPRRMLWDVATGIETPRGPHHRARAMVRVVGPPRGADAAAEAEEERRK